MISNLGSIGKLVAKAGAGTNQKVDFSQLKNALARLNGPMGSMTQAARGALGPANASVGQMMKGGGTAASNAQRTGLGPIGKAIGNALREGGEVEKLAYVAALQSAIDRALASGSFNLEVHKNDLWIKLGNLQSAKSEMEDVQRLLAGQQQLLQQIGDMLQKFTEASRSMIQSIGR